MVFCCRGCGQEFLSEAKRDDHVSSCQPCKDYKAVEAKWGRGEKLTRKEMQAFTGVSPSSQRRYEKIGLEEGYLIKDESGGVYLNPETVKMGPRIRWHRRKHRRQFDALKVEPTRGAGNPSALTHKLV